MPLVYALTFGLALWLSFSRQRIWVVCLFLCVYGTIKVMAQDQSVALSWSELLLFRALYPILCLSLLVRAFRDPFFWKQISACPLGSYSCYLASLLFTATYSISRHSFDSSQFNIWGQLVIAMLFVIAAGHIQAPNDLIKVASTVVCTSLVLASWVLWTTIHLDFSAFRGGIEVNQNYVSLFVLAGAIPLLHALFTVRGFWKKTGIFVLFVAVLLGAVLLASRGVLIAFVAAVLIMSPRLIPGKAIKSSVIIASVTCTVLSLGAIASMVSLRQDISFGSLNGRGMVWTYSLQTLVNSGFPRMIFGFGYNSAEVLLPPVMEPGSWNYHNEYLNSLMDGGIIGLSILSLFLISIWKRIKASKHSMQNVMRGWFIFLLVTGLSGVITGVHIFWLLLGAICGGAVTQVIPVPQSTKAALPVRVYRQLKGAIFQSVSEDLEKAILRG